jgi:hypothetical protein
VTCAIFITEMKSVYSAVQTRPLNEAVCASSLTVNVCINFKMCIYLVDK